MKAVIYTRGGAKDQGKNNSPAEPNNPQRAAIYVRVSTEDQGKGYSLPEQVAACQKYALEQGYLLVGTYPDEYTGTNIDRPGLDALRDAIKSDRIGVVIVYDLDRLARKSVHQMLIEEEFSRLGVTIEYVNGQYEDTPEGRLQKAIKAGIAEYEREKILERTQRGRNGKAKAGNVVTNFAPFGYNLVNGDHTSRLEINDDEARIVRMIFDWFLLGEGESGPLSTYKIAILLTEMRIPTHGDTAIGNRTRFAAGVWHSASVANILTNETYTGTWHYRKMKQVRINNTIKMCTADRTEWIPVSVPPIIDQLTFERARIQAKRNRERAKRNRKHDYLLGGRLRCRHCSYALTGSKPRAHRIYRCKSIGALKGKLCTMSNVYAAVLEKRVWEWFANLIRNPEDTVKALQEKDSIEQEQQQPLRDRLAIIEERIAEMKRRIRNLDDQLEVEIDADNRAELRERKAQRIKTKIDLESERATFSARLENRRYTPERLRNLAAFFRSLEGKLDRATPEQKCSMFDLFDLKVELSIKDGRLIAHIECELGEDDVEIVTSSTSPIL